MTSSLEDKLPIDDAIPSPQVDAQHTEKQQIKAEVSSTESITTGPNPVEKPAEKAASEKITLEAFLRMDEELLNYIARKKDIEKNLVTIETQIYNAETKYLEKTNCGNLVKGFDGFLFGAGTQQRGANVNMFATSLVITDTDRIFSNSSSTFRKSLQTVRELQMANEMPEFAHHHEIKKKSKRKSELSSTDDDDIPQPHRKTRPYHQSKVDSAEDSSE